MVAAGLNAADPSLDLNLALTPKALSLLPVVDSGCNTEVFKAFSADPFDSLVKREALNQDPWKRALLANEPGQVKTPAPAGPDFVVTVHATTFLSRSAAMSCGA